MQAIKKFRRFSAATASEDEPGLKWDRCVADMILKTGSGLGIGIVFSLLLKRRAWPIFVGSGFGIGYAMSNCQHDFKRVDSLHLQPIRVTGSVNESTPQENTGSS